MAKNIHHKLIVLSKLENAYLMQDKEKMLPKKVQKAQ